MTPLRPRHSGRRHRQRRPTHRRGRRPPRRLRRAPRPAQRTAPAREKINGKWAIYGLGNNIAAQSTKVTGTLDGLLVRVQFSRGADGRWTTSDVAWVPSRQDVGPPYRWCSLTAGQPCSSPAEDAASLRRTASAVSRWGANSDGARRM